LVQSMDRMNLLRVAANKVPYAMPVTASHRFTSGFGTRRDPVTGARRAHNGLDFAAPLGTPIKTSADGVVVFAGRQRGFGKLIKVRHTFGFETLYAHLNKIHVKVGDRVSRGDHIGDMGTTGRSTGVHLHYEVRIGGKPVNPMIYIKAARDVL
ncbi:MAG: M23 family metallopeptidase, partial [Pseudomonadota bacterium]